MNVSLTYKNPGNNISIIKCPTTVRGKLVIPDMIDELTVTEIGEGAFRDCDGLTDVTIPNSVKSIGYAAFSGCSGLTRVILPDGDVSIGEYAFSGCFGLKTVIVSKTTTIGDKSFSYMTDVIRK